MVQQPGFQLQELCPKAWVPGSGSGGQPGAWEDTSIRAKEKRDKGQVVEEERRDHRAGDGVKVDYSPVTVKAVGEVLVGNH